MIAEARLIRMRYPGECLVCAKDLGRGSRAWWNDQRRFVTCVDCSGIADDPNVTPPDLLVRTGFADEQHKRDAMHRLRDADTAIRSAYAGLGRLIWDVSSARASTKVWGPGSHGKRVTGVALDRLVDHGMIVLHDVRMPSERKKVDHVVVAPSGIHVIESVHYPDERIEMRKDRRFIGRSSALVVGGRDFTDVVDDLEHQVRRIAAFTDDLADVRDTPVTPVLCFVDASWKRPRRRLALGSVEILWPKAMMRLISRPGPLRRERIEELGCRLASRLVYDFNDP
jgi:hypothetical protein